MSKIEYEEPEELIDVDDFIAEEIKQLELFKEMWKNAVAENILDTEDRPIFPIEMTMVDWIDQYTSWSSQNETP